MPSHLFVSVSIFMCLFVSSLSFALSSLHRNKQVFSFFSITLFFFLFFLSLFLPSLFHHPSPAQSSTFVEAGQGLPPTPSVTFECRPSALADGVFSVPFCPTPPARLGSGLSSPCPGESSVACIAPKISFPHFAHPWGSLLAPPVCCFCLSSQSVASEGPWDRLVFLSSQGWSQAHVGLQDPVLSPAQNRSHVPQDCGFSFLVSSQRCCLAQLGRRNRVRSPTHGGSLAHLGRWYRTSPACRG